ncbi:MAG: hypothetical protein D6714_20655, partial [Bacteroidetes bacterium]
HFVISGESSIIIVNPGFYWEEMVFQKMREGYPVFSSANKARLYPLKKNAGLNDHTLWTQYHKQPPNPAIYLRQLPD